LLDHMLANNLGRRGYRANSHPTTTGLTSNLSSLFWSIHTKHTHTQPPFDLFSAHSAAAPPPSLMHGLASLVPQQAHANGLLVPQQTGLVPAFSQLPLFANVAAAAGHHGANALSQQQAAAQAAFAVALATAAGAQQQALAAATAAAARAMPVGMLAAPQQHHGQAVAAQAAVVGGHLGQAQTAVGPAAGAGALQQQALHTAIENNMQAAAQIKPSPSQHHHQHHPQAALVSTHGALPHPTVASADPRMQLQQAFLNSLMQASMSFPAANQLQVPHAAAAAPAQNVHAAPVQAVIAQSNHQQVSPPLGSMGFGGETQAHSILQPTSIAASIPQPTCQVNNETADFLSGFDNVAALNNSTTPPPRNDGMLHGSPPLTSSRSFDDFHRFLGDDLAMLDQTTKQEAAASLPQDNVSRSLSQHPPCAVPATMALFSADSYAMFAQESAMAASQHAAYLNDSGSFDGMKNTRKSPMFDIEGVVKLVSEHVPTQNRQGATPPPVVGNRAKTSPVNALDHLAEFYANQQQQQNTHHRHHKPHHPFLLRLSNTQGSSMMMTQGLSSQAGQLLHSPNTNVPQVSGSELTSATETESSHPGSTSESNGSDSNNGSESNNTGNEDSEDGNPDSMYSSNDSDASGSYSDEGPCPKKSKVCPWQTRPRNGSHANNNEET
jgi:hypothetical protein